MSRSEIIILTFFAILYVLELGAIIWAGIFLEDPEDR